MGDNRPDSGLPPPVPGGVAERDRPGTVPHLLRLHPRERLLVEPIQWTNRHLELLGVAFIEEPPRTRHASGPSRTNGLPDDVVCVKDLATSPAKGRAFDGLFVGPGGPLKRIRPRGAFRYDIQHTLLLTGATYALGGTQRRPDHNSPMLAFVQRQMVAQLRSASFLMPRSSSPMPDDSNPVGILRQRRLKLVQPSDPARDPYLAAVLIGLAQSQAEAHLESQLSPEEALESLMRQVFHVCALLVDESQEYLTFYHSQISPGFLGRFNFPPQLKHSAGTDTLAGLAIYYKRIPYAPYETLRERLLDEMIPSTEPNSSGTS